MGELLYTTLFAKLGDAKARSERESLALAFAERFATAHATIDDAFMASMRREFADAEIVDLGFTIAAFVAWGRLHRAFGIPPSSAEYHRLLATLAGTPEH